MTLAQRASRLRDACVFGMAGCALLSSCASPPHPMPAPRASVQSPAATHIAQVGFGDAAAFVQCMPSACPERTPKTLAAATPGQPSAQSNPVASDAARPTQPPLEQAASPVSVTRLLTLRFAPGSARLDQSAETRLETELNELAADGIPLRGAVITGRTDSSGAAALNEKLAQLRADAVRDRLLKLRPTLATTLTVRAQGNCCFVAGNDTPAGRAQNRRVEVDLLLGERS